MPFINVISRAPAVKEWLANSRQPRILHIFDHACNLINERREVLSIVTPQIGDGPFNLVLEEDICFSDTLDVESIIIVSSSQLILGALTINTADARLWDPRPDWERLHPKRCEIAAQLIRIPLLKGGKPGPCIDFSVAQSDSTNTQAQLSTLFLTLANVDVSSARRVASQIAGSGLGLTPAGDDVLMGAMYAARIIHPAEAASVLLQEIADSAAPLTTSLSAAWLKSAGKGEAGILWHNFFQALILNNQDAIQFQTSKLLVIGHTSGADALSGFVGLFSFWSQVKGEQYVNFNSVATGP